MNKEEIDKILATAWELERANDRVRSVDNYKLALQQLAIFRDNSPAEDFQNLSNLYRDINDHTEGLLRDIENERRESEEALSNASQATQLSTVRDPQVPASSPSSSPSSSSSVGLMNLSADGKESVSNTPSNISPPNSNGEQLNSQLKVIAAGVGIGIWKGAKATGRALGELNTKYQITTRLMHMAKKTKDKVVEVNEKYHITDKTKQVAISGYNKVKAVDNKYGISDKVTSGVRSAGEKVGYAISKVITLPEERIAKQAGNSSGIGTTDNGGVAERGVKGDGDDRGSAGEGEGGGSSSAEELDAGSGKLGIGTVEAVSAEAPNSQL